MWVYIFRGHGATLWNLVSPFTFRQAWSTHSGSDAYTAVTLTCGATSLALQWVSTVFLLSVGSCCVARWDASGSSLFVSFSRVIVSHFSRMRRFFLVLRYLKNLCTKPSRGWLLVLSQRSWDWGGSLSSLRPTRGPIVNSRLAWAT